MVDEAYADRTEWIKKSIRTTARVRPSYYTLASTSESHPLIIRWASSVLTAQSKTTRRNIGTSRVPNCERSLKILHVISVRPLEPRTIAFLTFFGHSFALGGWSVYG